MRVRGAVLAAAFLATASGPALAQGPGDPTTVFADGFNLPCRMAFDSVGNLFVAELALGEIWSVAPSGSRTLFTDQIPDPRWVAFDAFGWLLVDQPHGLGGVPDITAGRHRRVRGGRGRGRHSSPDRTGASGWAPSIPCFTSNAMGRRLEAIETRETYGLPVRGLYLAPPGEIYMTGSGTLWKLVAGVPQNLLTSLPLAWAGIAFDVAGNGYWTHNAMEEGDFDRLALVDLDGNWLNEAWITEVVDPCRCAFGRNPNGSTNSELYIGQRDGTIVKAAAGSALAAGWPVVGLRFSEINEAAAADEIMGVPDLLPDPTRVFLDVIGNNDGLYDVGDFRAYLIAAGVVN